MAYPFTIPRGADTPVGRARFAAFYAALRAAQVPE